MNTATALATHPQARLPTGDQAPESVPVRVLCDFGARRGDLDLRLTPSPTGVDGIEGHAVVTGRRGPGYQREVSLGAVRHGLRIQGRADGWDPDARRLEEIKTHRGDPALIRPNRQALHWAQARVYGWMLCEQLQLDGLHIALVYYDIDSGQETVQEAWHTRHELTQAVDVLCQRYADWAQRERAHRQARDQALRQLAFAHPCFRPGQRDLAAGVYRAHTSGQVLLAEAPTGIGKTAATLFAALKALPRQGTDRLFYLTARTTGRALALGALQGMGAGSGLPLRVVERLSREKACEHPDKACHGESCPLARGFYDRLPAARQVAAESAWLDHDGLRAIARAHELCPYYLAQEMMRWSDVAIGDYHHVFDPGSSWLAAAEQQEHRVALLVDEAHHLIGRARDMHSASLDPADFQALRQTAPPGLQKSLDRMHRHWNALAPLLSGPYTAREDLPADFQAGLRLACTSIADHLARHAEDAAHAGLMAWFFDALRWLQLADTFGDHSVCDLQPCTRPLPRTRTAQPVIGIRNLVPAPLLSPLWARLDGATLFSATLSPMDHMAHMLGLPAAGQPHGHRQLQVPSPFDPSHLMVQIATDLSTRWADRQRSLDPMADLMARQYQRAPGNYLAFFSSFDYLTQALDRLHQRHPAIPVWSQTRGMDEAARQSFIDRFVDGGRGIGFAVLGGAFGEGIDLPGHRLIGAFIATLGLPQVDPPNETLRQRLQARFGHGWEHTYLYPGLQKVIQAAGRVIRTEEDRGTVWLMDDRYARAPVRALLPPHWRVRLARAAAWST
ncbi:MAG: helicase C-terminal domain-containing protein [Gammaproteobacteria bacterium]